MEIKRYLGDNTTQEALADAAQLKYSGVPSWIVITSAPHAASNRNFFRACTVGKRQSSPYGDLLPLAIGFLLSKKGWPRTCGQPLLKFPAPGP